MRHSSRELKGLPHWLNGSKGRSQNDVR
jgi:hypothetical protein